MYINNKNIIFTDGYKNKQGTGYLISDNESHVLIKKEISKKSSNNVAEYCGVLNALELVNDNGIVYTDSKLVEGQVMFKWKIKKRHLLPYVMQCKKLQKKKNVVIKWIKRDFNKAGIVIDMYNNHR